MIGSALLAAALMVLRFVWELRSPLPFSVTKSAVYQRDALCLGPAALLALVAVRGSHGPARRWTGRLLAVVRRRPRAVVAAAAGATALACAAISTWVLLGVPHVVDEAAYLWQANLFAHGKVTGHPSAPSTLIEYVADLHAKRVTVFFPGSAAPLAFGVLAGCPQLVDPLLAGGLVAATAFLGTRLASRATGVLAAVLAALSPFVLYQGASYFGHTWSALLVTFAIALLVRPHGRRDLVLGGGALGLVLLSRPVTAVIVGAWVVGLWARRLRHGAESWRRAGIVVSAVVPGVLLLAAYDAAVTGSWHRTAHRLLLPDETAQLGMRALRNVAINVAGASVDVVALPVVALLGLVVVVRRSQPVLQWSLGCAATVLLAYALYYNNGVSYGPRYLFEVAPVLLVAVADVARRSLRPVTVVRVLLVVALGSGCIVATRAMVFHQRAAYLDLPAPPSSGRPALVVVSPGRSPFPDPFQVGFVRNGDLDHLPQVLYVRSELDGSWCDAAERFPGRDVYVWSPDRHRMDQVADAPCR